MSSRGVNKAIIIGNVGKDPEFKQFENGSLCSFSLATSEGWKDKATGEKQERTEWHRIVCYEPLSKIASNFLKKGTQVYIEGQIKTRKWDKDGETRYSTEIVARSLQILSPKDKVENDDIPNTNNNLLDQDIPF